MVSILAALAAALVPLVGLSTLYLSLPVLAPMLTSAAGVAPEAYGLLGGAIGFGSIWFYAANHAVTPSLGPIRTLQIGTVVGLAGAALVLSGVWWLMILGAMFVGFGYATTTPAGSQIMADQTPRHTWATLFSIRQAGVPIGGVLAGVFASGLAAVYGWRVAMVVVAAFCLATGVLIFLAPRRFNEGRPRQAFRLSAVFQPRNLLRPFRAIAETPQLLRLTLACVGFAVVQGATISFFVTYLNAGLHYDLAFAGSLFAALQATSVAGRLVLGFVADWLRSTRHVLLALALLSAASSFLLASLEPGMSATTLFAVAIFAGASVATWNGIYLAEIATLVPADGVSEATAAATFFVFTTYMLTPPTMGLIVRLSGYSAAYSFAGCMALLAFAALVFGSRLPKAP